MLGIITIGLIALLVAGMSWNPS